MRFARYPILVFWCLAGALSSFEAPHVVERVTAHSGTPAGTESDRADRLLRARFAEPAADLFVVTLEAPAALDSGEPRRVLDSLTAALARQRWARRVTAWPTAPATELIAADHRLAAIFVTLDPPRDTDAVDLVLPARAMLAATVARTARDPARYRVHMTGEAPLDADLRAVSEQDSRRSELRLAPLTLIVLIAAFGALVAATLPLVVGFLSIWISLAIIALLARVMPMSVFVLNITTMLGLGVGIDYSLLVITRFREELAEHEPVVAAARAAATAGRAVITSGLTVLAGFGALLLTPMVETRSLAAGGLIVVGVSVALATTLLPALLSILGDRIDRPRWLAARLAWLHTTDRWRRWAAAIIARPWSALAAGLAVVALLALPLARITIGLPARHWWPSGTDSQAGATALERLRLGAVAEPIRVLVELPIGASAVEAAPLAALRDLGDTLAADPRVRLVRSVAEPTADVPFEIISSLYGDLDAARSMMPGFLDAYLSRDRRIALLDVVLADSVSFTSATAVVRRTRLVDLRAFPALRSATVTVGGFFAGSLDLQHALLSRFPLLIALILGVTGIMLAVAFRSVLVPLKALAMNLLSVAASFGVFVWVFQLGHGAALFGLNRPAEAIFGIIPVLVFAITFGLSMDYEVFLLARVKERFDATGRNDLAVEEGLSASAGVITSAALIMILVFGAFAFARVFVVQVLGFGLAVAVLLDATLIRMVIVPALMHLAGEWNWWPGVRRRR